MSDMEKEKLIDYDTQISEINVSLELQYREHESDISDITKRVAKDYTRKGNDVDDIKSIHIYLKPTEFTAYYVINDTYEGKVPLF